MLGTAKVMTFVATNQPEAALAFYRDVLGLAFVEDNGFSLVFDIAGTHLRVQKTRGFVPPPHTALGWEVPDIVATMDALVARGVRF
jgi:catechol 2,3-dioxygenase-like lactoylglutathione lyase family enzyme